MSHWLCVPGLHILTLWRLKGYSNGYKNCRHELLYSMALTPPSYIRFTVIHNKFKYRGKILFIVDSFILQETSTMWQESIYVHSKKQYICNISVRIILIKDREVWKFTNWLCGTESVIALDLQLQGLRKWHATSSHKHHNIYGITKILFTSLNYEWWL